MWTYHNKKMKELKKIYQRASLQTQNKIQEIFDSYKIDPNTLFNIADTKTKRRINTYIEELKDKDLLNGEFGNLARNIYNRTRVKNSEILEFLIYSAYIEEQSKLEEKEIQIFKEDSNYYYQEGQKEVNKTLNNEKIVSIIPDAIFLSLLTTPNVKGYVYEDYINAIIKYNADQIYRQAIIDIQQQKPLEIESDAYQGIIKKQQNQKLNINGDKISGDIDLTLIGINNKAKVEGITSADKEAKVRFIAVGDERTTPMCESMDNMIFNVNDWNSFYRYSDYDKKNVFYKVNGLVTGVNLPPIDNHFHFCRSTITYQINSSNNELIALYNSIKPYAKFINIEFPDNIEKFADLRYNSKGYIDNILSRKEAYDVYKEQVMIGGREKEVPFEEFYNIYTHRHQLENIITSDGIEVGKVRPHTMYRLADRKIVPSQVRNILEKGNRIDDSKNNSILYTIDYHTYVVIANDRNHNIKTSMKRRKSK